MLSVTIQTALAMIYPPRCLTCWDLVNSDFGLCGPFLRDTPLIGGAICDGCGVPLIGNSGDGELHCDDCWRTKGPWANGRSVILYNESGRRIVLGPKNGDLQDLVRPASIRMATVAHDILKPNMLLVPVPLHWTRLLKRRYNQSALLAKSVAKHLDLAWCPDALQQFKRTQALGGMVHIERFAHLRGVMKVHTYRMRRMIRWSALLIDEVMTFGATLAVATLAVATEACYAGGADHVFVLTLARAAKDP